jgi:hypothetical protein
LWRFRFGYYGRRLWNKNRLWLGLGQYEWLLVRLYQYKWLIILRCIGQNIRYFFRNFRVFLRQVLIRWCLRTHLRFWLRRNAFGYFLNGAVLCLIFGGTATRGHYYGRDNQ